MTTPETMEEVRTERDALRVEVAELQDAVDVLLRRLRNLSPDDTWIGPRTHPALPTEET